MVSCERCGSIRLVRVHSSSADRFVALVTGRRLFLCRRCGWRARRKWVDDELVGANDTWSPIGAAIDPEMLVLDQIHSQQRQWKHGGQRRLRRKFTQSGSGERPVSDFGALHQIANEVAAEPLVDFGDFADNPDDTETGAERPRRSPIKHLRTKRQEVYGVIAFGMLVVSVVVLLMFAQSCHFEAAL